VEVGASFVVVVVVVASIWLLLAGDDADSDLDDDDDDDGEFVGLPKPFLVVAYNNVVDGCNEQVLCGGTILHGECGVCRVVNEIGNASVVVVVYSCCGVSSTYTTSSCTITTATRCIAVFLDVMAAH
jgi:hypothetical protein